ncbi:MAG: Dna2/Cas4 domain-containing protein, partial [Gammaproteobacteria bacterium]|nr:Dna2/Cas4 domain-containing protein [Gammaproteobacteria bacterium]
MSTETIRPIPDHLISETEEPDNPPLQLSLPLDVGKHPESPLIPARILNEFVYCPRLAYLEWVQKEWADSSDTVEGRHVHRRVDKKSEPLPDPKAEAEPEDFKPARSVELSSAKLDLVAKIDLVEPTSGGEVVPVTLLV